MISLTLFLAYWLREVFACCFICRKKACHFKSWTTPFFVVDLWLDIKEHSSCRVILSFPFSNFKKCILFIATELPSRETVTYNYIYSAVTVATIYKGANCHYKMKDLNVLVGDRIDSWCADTFFTHLTKFQDSQIERYIFYWILIKSCFNTM